MAQLSETINPATALAGAAGARSRLRKLIDHQRSTFLRLCRKRLKPEDVGLPPEQRSRGGGLQRSAVAALSGVSVSWYTWLEQGRDMRVSDDVLERISHTLQLSEGERAYLFSLVQQRPPRLVRPMVMETPAAVARLIESLPIPAVVMNLRCDVLSWNAINTAIYRDYSLLPPEERNLLEILFLRPGRQLAPEVLEMMARRLIGRLRYDYSKCAGDQKFDAMIHRLLTHSPVFSRLWRMPDGVIDANGSYAFTHPRFGELVFDHTSYVPDGCPYIRIVTCVPLNDAARKAVATANEELAAAR